jgi:DNA-binding NarL/FixJ family response regulator
MTWWKNLSPREGEVALLVARGLANKGIARELGLSEGTVKQHVHSILLKLRTQKLLISGVRGRSTLIHLMRDSQGQSSFDLPPSVKAVVSSVLE